MLIIGTGGHAKEIFDILSLQDKLERIYFFEEPNYSTAETIFNEYQIVRDIGIVLELFKEDNRYVLAIGNPNTRYRLNKLFQEIGGKLISVISSHSIISTFDVELKNGLNIMKNVIISPSTKIGEGVLVNAASNVHHDVIIGDYCEINPSVMLLGHVQVDKYCSIGTGSIILPNRKIEENSIIGAGSVVTKDIPKNSIAYGVPARIIKQNSEFIL